jgi:NTE family protein
MSDTELIDTEAGAPTEHSVETYLPEPESQRSGMALCLSGGGFRAALFHLGALCRLNELGILSQVTRLSSVSGGSIISAHLAERIRNWPAPGAVLPNWEQQVAAPFRAFASKNIRTGPLLRRLLPWNWARPSAPVEALAARYRKDLTGLKLPDLPGRPNFIFCAADMVFGVNWVFERNQVGDYQAGYLRPAPDWPVARAVAASSCFPPVFEPIPIGLRPDQLRGGNARSLQQRDKLVSKIHLTDGGTYDNMGLEPVWKKSDVVLVSDGGARFHFEWDRLLVGRILRYTSIVGNQASSVRKRWLISSFIARRSGDAYSERWGMDGTYWGISSAAQHYVNQEDGIPPRGYSPDLITEVISEVRTDLDAFTKAETGVLENHGYFLADAAIQQHTPELIKVAAPLAPPHGGDFLDEAWVRKNLTESHKRFLLGRPWRLPVIDG